MILQKTVYKHYYQNAMIVSQSLKNMNKSRNKDQVKNLQYYFKLTFESLVRRIFLDACHYVY